MSNIIPKIIAASISTFVLAPSTIAQTTDGLKDVIFATNDPAPTLKSKDGSAELNLTGRLFLDWSTGKDDNVANDFSGTQLRAAWFGIQGKVTDKIKYNFIADFSNNDVHVKDAYVKFEQGDWAYTVGQSKVPNSLEWNTSVSQTSFMERAAFKSAFGFGRAMGIKAATGGDDWGFSAGVFQGTDVFSSGTKEGYIASARATYGGKISTGTWMIGASGRYRDMKASTLNYKAKAVTNQSMTLSNFSSSASKETLYAAEAAITIGSLFATAEYAFADAKDAIAINTDAKFSGGYVELGYVLTGESRPLNIKSGGWGRPVVNAPVGKGGSGMWMLTMRFDTLDLNSNGALGGEQTNYVAGVSWHMTRYLRAILNYGHSTVKNRGTLGMTNTADVIGLRMNIDW